MGEPTGVVALKLHMAMKDGHCISCLGLWPCEYEQLRARIKDLEGALRDLSKQARTVCGFAVSWQPLTPGDIRELKEATGEASALS